MDTKVIGGVIVAALAIGGYIYVTQTGEPAKPDTATVTDQAVEATAAGDTGSNTLEQAADSVAETAGDVVEAVEEAASDVAQATGDAAETVMGGASDAADAASDAADAVVDQAGEAVSGATEAATDAVNSAVEGVADTAAATTEAADNAADNAVADVAETATEAMGAVTDAVSDTVESASDAVDAATDTATEAASSATAGDMSVLTADGFNLDKVTQLIEGSNLEQLQKTALVQAVKAAQDNPEALKATLDAVKGALGM